MQARYSVSIAASLVLTCCFSLGCQRIPIQQGMLERESTDSRLSSHQLRVMVNEFVMHFADRVELSADRILANTSDPAIRKNALLWKINGISACFQAASRPDPLGAYLDIWILNRQTMHLFESPEGGELFGPWLAIAIEECHALERRLQHINAAIGADFPLGEEFVLKFSGDFPLTSLYFDREPIASRYIEEVQEPARELYQVIGNLDDSLNDLRALSILYAKHLPKQARWEAQLLLIDTTQLTLVQRPLQDFSLTANAMSRIAETTETMPQLLERERNALREIVADEREQTLIDFDRMRRDTVTQFADERAIVLDAIREEREAVLEVLTAERSAISRDLDAEVTKALQAADSITRRRAEELVEQAPRVIDHFFWRAWQVCFAIALVGAAVAWLVFRAKSRRPEAPATLVMRIPADEHIAFSDSAGERAKAA